jgi:hypothetical protein
MVRSRLVPPVATASDQWSICRWLTLPAGFCRLAREIRRIHPKKWPPIVRGRSIAREHGGGTMAVSIRGVAEPLADQIIRLVQSKTGGQIDGLSVSVTGGDVVISGRARSYYLKQLATHAALDLAGRFTTLTNEIVVG